MRRAFIFLLLLCSFRHVIAQTDKTIDLANKFLNNGNHKAAITVYEFPGEIQALQQKAMKHLKADPEWADKYIVRMVEKGSKDLSYMEAYGLTRNEFDKMLAGFRRDKQAIFSDTFNIIIKRTNDIIFFKGENKLAVFNHLSIDTKNKQLVYDNKLLTKELELIGQKNYAPILYGYEAFWDSKIPGKKQLTKVTSAGLSIGKNKGDERPMLCLILTKGFNDVEFFCITLL